MYKSNPFNAIDYFPDAFKCVRLVVTLSMVILTGCAFAPWETPTKEPLPPESRVEKSQEAMRNQPDNTKLRKDFHVTKESAVKDLLIEANQAFEKGDIQSASDLYDRVLSIAPENQSAQAGRTAILKQKIVQEKLANVESFIAQKQTAPALSMLREILLEDPDNAKALSLKTQLLEQETPSAKQRPELRPVNNTPVTLELRDANIKVVFDALSKATGINFILDKDIRPDAKATLYVKQLPVTQAIDMVLASNGLQKKVLTENTALVFPSNTQKLKEYQDLMIRSFYVTNTSAKQVATLIKTMLKTKDIYVDDRLNMLVIRDTPEVVNIAEKLVKANDIADPEVMLEMEVLEVSRNRLQELGINYPSQLSVLSAGTTLTLDELKRVDSTTIGVSPNPAINFKKTTGDVNLLSNPRIRVKNNEKAKILVGDKVPIITTTSTANVGVSENVTYVDVGLKLDVEPRITLDNFVNIKVGLEVSSLGDKTVTTNGATVYTIGTRNADTVLRLKDGETQILAGLILDDERKSATKLPGLGDLPLIGRLFSNQEDKKNKTEIVLAITPRILTNISLPHADISEYWSGTENLITDRPMINPAVTGGGRGDSINTRMPLRRDNNITPPDANAVENQDSDSTEENTNAEPNTEPTADPNKPNTTTPAANNGPLENGNGSANKAIIDTANPPPHM